MEDRCVVCGEIVPEGRMVCPICEWMLGIDYAGFYDVSTNNGMEEWDNETY